MLMPDPPEYPDTFGELPEAVQVNEVPGIPVLGIIVVFDPEQTEEINELLMIVGF